MIAESEAADRETKETIAAMKLAADLQKQDKVPFGG
jgi:hypothetical protein